MAKYRPKQIAIGVISVLAIAGAAIAIYFQTRPPGINVPLHRTMGEVLVEQAAAVTNAGKIVLITIDGNKYPEIKAQIEGVESALAKRPMLKLYRTVEVETEGKPKYGPGRGLSEERFLRIVKKYSGRAAIVISLIGSPELNKEQLSELPKPMPIFIAETRGRDELVEMFSAGAIHAAVVPRFIFPAPVEKPRTARDWFDTYFQAINPSNAKADDQDSPKSRSKSGSEATAK
jgi:hypothetical protein